MCTGYERGLKIYYKEKEKINEKKKKIILKSAIVIGLLIFIIIVIQLYSYTKQIPKSNLNNVLEQAQQNQEIYIIQP